MSEGRLVQIKGRLESRRLLKLLAAASGETMVDLLHRVVTNELRARLESGRIGNLLECWPEGAGLLEKGD